MRHSRHERPKAPLLLHLRRRQRKRAHGSSVEAPHKADDLLSSRVIARQLDRALHGLGAGVPIVDTVRPRHRSNRRQARCHLRHQVVVKIRPGHMNQLRRLLLHRLHDLRVAMPRRGHCNSRREIQKLIPIDIFDTTSIAALHHQRISARITRRQITIVFGHDLLRAWAGHYSGELRAKTRMHLGCSHAGELLRQDAHWNLSSGSATDAEPCRPGCRPYRLERRARDAHLDWISSP